MKSLEEKCAEVILNYRGFNFYDNPEEGGQDAYDISLEAIDEARNILELIKEQGAWTTYLATLRVMRETAAESGKTLFNREYERDRSVRMMARNIG
jgi:hypothetical protein